VMPVLISGGGHVTKAMGVRSDLALAGMLYAMGESMEWDQLWWGRQCGGHSGHYEVYDHMQPRESQRASMSP